MKSKDWIEQALKVETRGGSQRLPIGKRARLAEALLTSRKERRT